MGLDMYLTARRHVSGYEWRPDKEYSELVQSFNMDEFVDPDTPSAEVRFTVGYWRKANQIHRWFVINAQNGHDDCGSYYVSRDQLEVLRDLCMQVLSSTEMVDGLVHNGTIYSAEYPEGAVQLQEGRNLADPRVAHELLPTQEGFFFGGTDYDEFYWRDLEHTVALIERIFKLDKEWSFEYRSSW